MPNGPTVFRKKSDRFGSLHITPHRECRRSLWIDARWLASRERCRASCLLGKIGPFPQGVGDEAAAVEEIVDARRIDTELAQVGCGAKLPAQAPRPDARGELHAQSGRQRP